MTDPTMLALALLLGVHCGRASRPVQYVPSEAIRQLRPVVPSSVPSAWRKNGTYPGRNNN